MSYGNDFVDLFRHAAVDRILRGDKLADLPVADRKQQRA
jgi:hypothetical protein